MESSIKRINKDFEIVELDEQKLFVINSRDIKIEVYDKEILDRIFENKVNQKYQKLLYLVMSITESDEDNPSDTELALIKIDEFKELLLNNYGKYLSKYKLNKYLKMLLILESKLNNRRVRRGR